MKTTIELDDRDWGNIIQWLSEVAFRHQQGVQIRAVRKEINRQRKPVSAKTKREAARDMRADIQGDNGNG